MLRIIIYREFLANIITLRFLLGLVICLCLVGANAYVLTQSYEDRLQSYQLAVQTHTDEIRNIKVYSELSYTHRPKADKKPRLMSMLNEGVGERLGNTVEVSYNCVPVRAEQYGSDNPYLVVFRKIDLTLIFQIVISLLALLFSYDTISGAREDGTLSLTLSNPISRGIILLGKYLGGMFSLVLILIMSLLIGLIVILLSPYGTVSASDWARIVLFFLVSLIYVSVFFTLGMLFSSRTNRTATALMLAMFFWVISVLVWPNASSFAVSKLVPIKSDADLTMEGFIDLYAKNKNSDEAASHHRIADLWFNQYDREVNNYAKKRGVSMDFGGMMSSFFGGETIMGKFHGPPEKLPLYHEYLKFKEELRISYADREGRIWQEYLAEYPIRQAKLAHNITRISPASAYASATSILAETDLDSYFRFLQQAKQYRDELIQYLHDQKAFGSEAWYNETAGKKIDTKGIPLFHERPESLSSGIKRASFDISILVLLNVVFFLLTHLLFLRYKVR